MKKYGIILVLILISHAAFSQTMDKLFMKFANQENVTHVSVGPFLMKISSCFTKTMGVNSIEILEFSECSNTIRKELATDFKTIKDPKFETLVKTNDGGSHTTIWVRIDKKIIRELIIFTTDEGNALIRIKGKIKPEDIDHVIKDHKHGC